MHAWRQEHNNNKKQTGCVEYFVIVTSLEREQLLVVLVDVRAIGLGELGIDGYEALALHLGGDHTRDGVELLVAAILDDVEADDVAEHDYLHGAIDDAHAKALYGRRTHRRVREYAQQDGLSAAAYEQQFTRRSAYAAYAAASANAGRCSIFDHLCYTSNYICIYVLSSLF